MKKIGCLFFLIILIGAAGFGLYYWNFYNDAIKKPNDGSSEKKIVTIEKNQSVDDINKILVSEGIIKDLKFPNDMTVFKVYSVVNKLDSKYQAGTYFLAQNLTLKEVTDALQQSKDELISVTIREGLRIEEIAEAINVPLNSPTNSKYSKYNKEEFIKLVKNFPDTEKKYEFLSTRPKEIVTLEGYLYPDTYFVTKNVDTKSIVELLLKTFELKAYTPNKGLLQNNKYKFHELLTLASIVEREANISSERGKVADIFFRRLDINNDTGGKLESDVTVQYIVGNATYGWWPKDLTYQDLNKKNSYNTRINPGLPPTPIDSPSLSSLKAVLNPIPNDSLFFIAGDDGNMYYAKTIAQHENNIYKHCKEGCR